ncbi:hypothetical protein C0J52_10967 [Blattella germanica]|nr:hypothetical protein C0J52_10967 [Blattella germanica]
MYSAVGVVLSLVLIPALILWLWLLIPAVRVLHQCPTRCWCDIGGTHVKCVNLSMRDVSIRFQGLKKLSIDYNNITVLKRNAFLSNGLIELEVLSVKNCGLESLEAGAFNGLLALEKLFLKSNKLRDLKPCTFGSLIKLEYLYLAYNEIEAIDSYVFRGLVNLQNVVLDYNNIRSIKPDAFKSNIKLSKLSLRNNHLLQIPSHSPFVDAPYLEQLFLPGCNISRISGTTFMNTPGIKILDLSNNSLETINKDIFGSLCRLSRIHLSGNPFRCDCDLQEVWNWTEGKNITTVSYLEVPKCTSPKEVSGLWWGVFESAKCENGNLTYHGDYKTITYEHETFQLEFRADTDLMQIGQAVLYTTLFVFGAVGNVILLFITMSNREMRTEPNMYIFNLALCDLLSLSANLPISQVHWFIDTWEFGEFLCKFFMFCRRLTVGVSAYSVAILSIQRYHVTVNPIQNRVEQHCMAKWHVPLLNILAVWVLAAAFALPSAFSASAKRVCGMFYSSSYYQKVVIFELVVSCILPLCVIVFMYAMTARQLVQSVTTTDHPHASGRRNIAKIVLGLVLVFIVSFVPYHAIRTYRYWNELAYERGLQYAWSLSSCILVFNSCFNPVALFCSSSSIRKSLMRCACRTASVSITRVAIIKTKHSRNQMEKNALGERKLARSSQNEVTNAATVASWDNLRREWKRPYHSN